MPTSEIRGLLLRAAARAAPDSSDYDLNAGMSPSGRKLRPAAVLVAIDVTGADPQVILTKRSARLKHHPGQIAFPGGQQDSTDPTPEAAALRESAEEIGLPPDRVDVIGRLPPHETVTGFSVTPVLGLVARPFTAQAEAGEVAEIFRVPFSVVTDPGRFRVESRNWQRMPRYYYVVPWGPYYIWGATARMLRALADAVAR